MAMPKAVRDLVTERKYPFVLVSTIFLLLVSATLFLLSDSDSPYHRLLPFSSTSSDLAVPAPPAPRESSSASSDPIDIEPPPPPPPPPFQEPQTEYSFEWRLCGRSVGPDYIPCLDNMKVIKALKSRRHMEHRERHCPPWGSQRCLVSLPIGYKVPVPWPKSRDMVWYNNVPHPKLVEYKKDQNWVRKEGDYFVFPGGGTQFKDGVGSYVDFIQQTFPIINWGKNIRVILDVGCGVASFGGYLLDRDVITMSFAPKDEHEAQIQFALERGIPAILSVIGTQKLTFPDNAFDLLHCARCRVHWDADGGKPLYELNRILRPGGFFVWSATPVYRDDERDQNVWNSMVNITKSMCWDVVAKATDSSRIGLVIYQKPVSSSCYERRKESTPPLCEKPDQKERPWYLPLDNCLTRLPGDGTGYSWPSAWPKRLGDKPPSFSGESKEMFYEDTQHWSALVSDMYMEGIGLNWSRIRNVMDMNAGYGGFAAALVDMPLWVMNVVPVHVPDTLSVIFDRGLIGTYHDWCESYNTYPRTYDLLHSSFLFRDLRRCEMVDVVVEMDRVVRPGGYVVVQDTVEMMDKLGEMLRSLHWGVNMYRDQLLVGEKGFWRPQSVGKE
ncbi:hypothetical protein MLD38_008774 [Melastoma candidum]|uniref:Uncharacterized protein n=1 Tax=Melastoma candidum TaxID=119954 RepID=A0ACB9RVE5_9MYRT|nr:hypothetical protein MLD38_008774 [Melastoma candidum]